MAGHIEQSETAEPYNPYTTKKPRVPGDNNFRDDVTEEPSKADDSVPRWKHDRQWERETHVLYLWINISELSNDIVWIYRVSFENDQRHDRRLLCCAFGTFCNSVNCIGLFHFVELVIDREQQINLPNHLTLSTPHTLSVLSDRWVSMCWRDVLNVPSTCPRLFLKKTTTTKRLKSIEKWSDGSLFASNIVGVGGRPFLSVRQKWEFSRGRILYLTISGIIYSLSFSLKGPFSDSFMCPYSLSTFFSFWGDVAYHFFPSLKDVAKWFIPLCEVNDGSSRTTIKESASLYSWCLSDKEIAYPFPCPRDGSPNKGLGNLEKLGVFY